MAFPKAVLSPAPQYLQGGSYTAQDDRREVGDIVTPGIVAPPDYAVTLTTGRGISVFPGIIYGKGLSVPDQGIYRQRITAPVTLTDDVADGANPRLDQVIFRVMDSTADTSGLQEGRIEIATGTPASGATLDNRSGAADLTALPENSKSVELIADLLMPAGAAGFVSANLRDRRRFAHTGMNIASRPVNRLVATGFYVVNLPAAETDIFNFTMEASEITPGKTCYRGFIVGDIVNNTGGNITLTARGYSLPNISGGPNVFKHYDDVIIAIPTSAVARGFCIDFRGTLPSSDMSPGNGMGTVTIGSADATTTGTGGLGATPLLPGAPFLVNIRNQSGKIGYRFTLQNSSASINQNVNIYGGMLEFI